MADTKGMFDFAIDRGGTFTDTVKDTPTEGIRRVLEEETGKPFPREQPVDSSLIGWIRMGTTVATNALLERDGERTALLVTKGFKDLLHIGTQARPKLFDLGGCHLPRTDPKRTVTGSTGDSLEVWKELDLKSVEEDLRGVLWSAHEEAVGELARRLGFSQVSLSSEVMPMVRAVPRGYTVCADAYLTPKIRQYLKGFTSGFQGGLKDVDVLFMQSDGGLTPMERFCGSRAVLSGPAGGVVGYAVTSYDRAEEKAVIGFDMGGGPLTVTDANLVLGRLMPSFFPRIFGPGENEPLSLEESLKHFRGLAQDINHFLTSSQSQPNGSENGNRKCPDSKSEMTVEEVAMGFIRVANEAMCRPIRALTQAKGHDTSQHILACFGGAGGQHACAIARALGMKTVFIHNGVLSAYGLALADVVEEVQEPCSLPYGPASYGQLDRRVDALDRRCRDTLAARGFSSSLISSEVFLHLRYEGTDCALMVSAHGYPSNAHYLKEFGFTIADRPIMVDDIRVRGSGKSGIESVVKTKTAVGEPKATAKTKCYFEGGYLDTSVYLWEELPCGHSIQGPAVIVDKNSTILVEPCCEAQLTEGGDMRVTVGSDPHCALGTELNAQMGRVLQRTSISTNIKERLDFSCAVFGPDGGLVSNAPHIPVHLGAMQETVQYQIRSLGSSLKEGDVILSNHPCAGGSHLPDLTVITPVFRRGVSGPVFFVASRGHHADIGGITPGSMPPHSTSLQQEGAVFTSFKLVTGGVFQEEAVTEALMAPARYPDCSGTRNLHDNLSDLRAQVAANQRGSLLSNAELAVRDMLKEFARKRREQTGVLQVESEDFMDDGTPIRLCVQINEEEGSAVFDFTGTGTEVWGNCNAPRAITLSALIYCLRCMGCLVPIQVVIPPGSILQPSRNAAVVGGNVLTSQRVVDVIFRAFEVCAASQGCMNNISFGNERSGYYETVAGGAGAGPGWNGRSGVHSHMTNTRITDPEILEKRYPVVLEQFSLRSGSGGAGKYRGGEGVVRKLLFRDKVVLSVLTERRSTRPYGLLGAESGASGLNQLHRADGRVLNLGAKTSVALEPGDMFCLYTPGGGGYGEEEGDGKKSESEHRRLNHSFQERGSVFEYRMAQEGV
ncbi:hypothetical protein CRUP_008717 [Coryphaenoides rupestris]|nr:hypothetical protein CRUP_008717 [Coryphaenoides rupestris]